MAKALRKIGAEDEKAMGINNFYPSLGIIIIIIMIIIMMTVLLEVIGYPMNIVEYYK